MSALPKGCWYRPLRDMCRCPGCHPEARPAKEAGVFLFDVWTAIHKGKKIRVRVIKFTNREGRKLRPEQLHTDAMHVQLFNLTTKKKLKKPRPLDFLGGLLWRKPHMGQVQVLLVRSAEVFQSLLGERMPDDVRDTVTGMISDLKREGFVSGVMPW